MLAVGTVVQYLLWAILIAITVAVAVSGSWIWFALCLALLGVRIGVRLLIRRNNVENARASDRL